MACLMRQACLALLSRRGLAHDLPPRWLRLSGWIGLHNDRLPGNRFGLVVRVQQQQIEANSKTFSKLRAVNGPAAQGREVSPTCLSANHSVRSHNPTIT